MHGGWNEDGSLQEGERCHTFVLTLGEGEPLFGICLIENETIGISDKSVQDEMPAVLEQLSMFKKAQEAADEANKVLSTQTHSRGFSYTFTHGAR